MSRAGQRRLLGELLVHRVRRPGPLLRLVQLPSEAPVHHVHLAEGAHHHVVRLEVAVDHAPAVREGQRLARALEHAEHAPGAPARIAGRAALEDLRERHALDQLHREVGAAVLVHADLVHGHDPGMVELARDARLVQEARELTRLDRARGRRPTRDELHRQRSVELPVSHSQDRAHPAAADLGFDRIALAEFLRRCKAAEQVLHPGTLGGRLACIRLQRPIDEIDVRPELAQLGLEIRPPRDQRVQPDVVPGLASGEQLRQQMFGFDETCLIRSTRLDAHGSLPTPSATGASLSPAAWASFVVRSVRSHPGLCRRCDSARTALGPLLPSRARECELPIAPLER